MASVELRERGVAGPMSERFDEVLTDEALAFVTSLHERFEPARQDLLRRRAERRAMLDAGGSLGFLEETRDVREGDWRVAPVPHDLQDRRVEITGPTDRKMVINALNSGARGFMADFEDSSSPTWRNQVVGQANLIDAIDGTISHSDNRGRAYELGEQTATLIVRPRGWHLEERHLRVGDDPIAGALFDFGLFAFHCASRLHGRGQGVYLYLPKLEHHREARIWNEVFTWSEERLGLPPGLGGGGGPVEALSPALQMVGIPYE